MTGLSIDCVQLRHVYDLDEAELVALDDINLFVEAGSTTAIMGPSGSGKSTLVNLLAGLHRPTSGQILIGDDDLASMREPARLRMRATRIGVAVQNPSRNLLPYGDAEDNIRFAQRGPRSYGLRRLPEPAELLAELAVGELGGVPVDRLSGGERQRVALAVAMSGQPGVLLADEPTSQLDTANRDRVVEMLQHIATHFGTTVVTVTHDADVAAGHGRWVHLHEGHVVTGMAP